MIAGVQSVFASIAGPSRSPVAPPSERQHLRGGRKAGPESIDHSIRLRHPLSPTKNGVPYSQVGGSPIVLAQVSADAGSTGRIHQCDGNECGAFLQLFPFDEIFIPS